MATNEATLLGMQMSCAECGCRVENGVVLEPCHDASCCCSELAIDYPNNAGGSTEISGRQFHGSHSVSRETTNQADVTFGLSSTETFVDDVVSTADLVNGVIHDMRAPLTVISGYLDLFHGGHMGEVPVQLHPGIEAMRDKADELMTLLDELLMVAQLETGHIPWKVERFDLCDLVSDASAMINDRATLLGATIIVQLAVQPVLVDGFRPHIIRIVTNLLQNALKYGGEQPCVHLSVQAGPPRVIVADHGVGITAEQRRNLFQRSYRASDTNVGSGLGLFLSRQLAIEHGGQLDLVESRVGEGSTFRLTLPMPHERRIDAD